MISEAQNIAEVIKAARVIQEFLWGEMNSDIGLEEFRRMLRKRVVKIDEISMSNPHWRIELKKRLLQTAAIAVNLITKIDRDELRHDGIHPVLPSNLPEFNEPLKTEIKCDCKFIDPWRCANDKQLVGQVACHCICHQTGRGDA